MLIYAIWKHFKKRNDEEQKQMKNKFSGIVEQLQGVWIFIEILLIICWGLSDHKSFKLSHKGIKS